MKVSRRFQLTVQTVLFIAVYSDKKEMTCENISKEMKCNPVVIKNILNILCKNNFLTKGSSISNIRLKRNIKDITLWDIYKITDEVDINNIFCSDDSQIASPIVSDLPELLSPAFGEIMNSMKDILSTVSVDSLLKKYNY
ncbi:Rrf2 family transcriptional regulator [Intestinibacter bartlettii]|uniref:Rrf2 family transcriptional regulator n=1 Tax=Intestinibacter bartlettii TaxID=261299 RepID=UPI000821542E|nr:Rrf2 family transcriptional regulator [Intestinibacter bartlettii]SCI45202.1 iron-responsive transcriptional regulator [uncultured Clostridium sp.]